MVGFLPIFSLKNKLHSLSQWSPTFLAWQPGCVCVGAEVMIPFDWQAQVQVCTTPFVQAVDTGACRLHKRSFTQVELSAHAFPLLVCPSSKQVEAQ